MTTWPSANDDFLQCPEELSWLNLYHQIGWWTTNSAFSFYQSYRKGFGKKKRPDLWNSSWILHQDSAPAHKVILVY